MEKSHMGKEFSPDPNKNLTEQTRLFLWKMGGGLTQSIKGLTEKVKENPYWGEGRGGVKKMSSFSTFRQFLTYDSTARL